MLFLCVSGGVKHVGAVQVMRGVSEPEKASEDREENYFILPVKDKNPFFHLFFYLGAEFKSILLVPKFC